MRKKIKIIRSYGPGETKTIAQKMARIWVGRSPWGREALILALEGDLGGGKTTFLQGFAKGLGIKEKILSPTFILMRRHQIPNSKSQTNSKFENFYHIDYYRIQKPKEILDLGWKEIIKNPRNIVAVEWAEKISKILPKEATKIKFEFINKKTRKIVIN